MVDLSTKNPTFTYDSPSNQIKVLMESKLGRSGSKLISQTSILKNLNKLFKVAISMELAIKTGLD